MAGSDKSSVLLFKILQSENYVEDVWSEIDENEAGIEDDEEKISHKDEEGMENLANASDEDHVEMEEEGVFDAGAALYSPGSVHSNDIEGNGQNADGAYK